MKKNNILVVVAHSDDETIGMGGTIKRHVNNEDNVFVISMTDGVSSRVNTSNIQISSRLEASKKASLLLGFKWEKTLNFLDNSLDTYPILKIIKEIEDVKSKINPNIVYTHSFADLNIDHKIVSNAVLTAFRPMPNENCKEIRLFEVSSSTDYGYKNVTGKFEPNLFINIENTWNDKLNALKFYEEEIKKYPHSRSYKGIENLAKVRGNQVGLNMAEAFEVIRKIEF